MVLNEPETSLHPSLLGPLARLVAEAARRTQVVLVTHSAPLLEALEAAYPDASDDEDVTPGVVPERRLVELTKDLEETRIVGQGLLTTPTWEWGRR